LPVGITIVPPVLNVMLADGDIGCANATSQTMAPVAALIRYNRFSTAMYKRPLVSKTADVWMSALSAPLPSVSVLRRVFHFSVLLPGRRRPPADLHPTALIEGPVAVVVLAVAHLDLTRIQQVARVIAVPTRRRREVVLGATQAGPRRRHAIQVVVGIAEEVRAPDGVRLVHVAVAVLVASVLVALLDEPRILQRVVVSAVAALGHDEGPTRPAQTPPNPHAPAVRVTVHEVVEAPDGILFVDRSVAVVVRPVAELDRDRRYQHRPVVAVAAHLGAMDRRRFTQALRVGADAVPVTVDVAQPARTALRALFVDHPVAVVVDAVAQLGSADAHITAVVVAVTAARRPIHGATSANTREVAVDSVGVPVHIA
jgi:hypothetical protein